ncbi:hypothetical protein XF35_25675 [Streptomyces platensis subsp. clarensis]|nr:hypothetical protein [Streptomyces platensis subsp. clarensis]
MAADTLFQRITDYAHRADPYPLYAELRESRVARQEDGSYLVGTYHEIAALLHDPRVSSDRRNRTAPDETGIGEEGLPPAFIGLDDPEHHRLRSLAMWSFGPPRWPRRAGRGALDGGEREAEVADLPGELGEYGAGEGTGSTADIR